MSSSDSANLLLLRGYESQEAYDAARWGFTVTLTLAHTLPVVFWFAFYTLLDCFPGYFKRFRIQQRYTPNQLALLLSRAAREDAFPKETTERSKANSYTFWKTVLQNLFQHFFTVPALLYFFAFDVFLTLNPATVQGPMPDPLTVAWHMVVCVLCEDLLFYWSHRTLHIGFLYTAFHKRHHEHHTPFSLGAEYAHPVESIIGNIVPFLSGPFVTGCHMYEVCLWFAIRMTKTAEAHSGYFIPGVSIFSMFPGCVSARQHDFHHSNNKGSYGSFLRFWDWACGTEDDFWSFRSKQQSKVE